MRHTVFCVWAVFLLTLAASAQRRDEKKAPRSPLPAAQQNELFAPYWTLEPGWHTELELRNNMPDEPKLLLMPNEARIVDIQAMQHDGTIPEGAR